MNFLKKLFGAGGLSQDPTAYFIYVRPKMCKEIVCVRVNLTNDASLNEDESGYTLRKTASAIRCPYQAEITLHLSKSRAVLEREITNGEFVTEADYQVYIAEIEKTEQESASSTSDKDKLEIVVPKDINLLAQYLQQEDPAQFDLQKAALHTLSTFASSEAVKIARNVIDNFEDRTLVNLAMDALAKMRTDEAFAALIDMMFSHSKVANRGAAVLALARSDSTRSLPPIKKMLSDGLISDEGLPIIDTLWALSGFSNLMRADNELIPIINEWAKRGGDYEMLAKKITWNEFMG